MDSAVPALFSKIDQVVMRIGIDVRCLVLGKRTGVEEYALALLGSIFERDRENEYVLFYNAWRKRTLDFSWATKYPNVTIRSFRFPNKLFNLCLWYFRYPKLDRLIGGVDVFFAPNLNFISVSKQARLIVTAHDLSFEYFPETFSLKQRLWHYLVNFRGLAVRADRIIAVSASTKDDLISFYGLSADKITVVQSGIGNRFSVFDLPRIPVLLVPSLSRLLQLIALPAPLSPLPLAAIALRRRETAFDAG